MIAERKLVERGRNKKGTRRDKKQKEMKVQQQNLKCIRNVNAGTSLVVQWLRIRLPMQGTQVRALVREDPTCHGATKPLCTTTTEPEL